MSVMAVLSHHSAIRRLGTIEPDLSQDLRAVPVTPDRNPLHVYAGRRLMPVTERLLDLAQAAFQISQDSRVGVSQLVQMDIPDARLACVALQIFDEGVRGERGARPPGPVVTSPERAIILQNAQPPARP